MTQWHETVNEEQIKQLTETIMNYLNIEMLPEDVRSVWMFLFVDI